MPDYQTAFIVVNNDPPDTITCTHVGTLADGRRVFHCIGTKDELASLKKSIIARSYKELATLDQSIWEPVFECTWSGKDVDGNTIIFRDKIAMKKAVAPAKAYIEQKIIPHQYAGWEVDEPQDI